MAHRHLAHVIAEQVECLGEARSIWGVAVGLDLLAPHALDRVRQNGAHHLRSHRRHHRQRDVPGLIDRKRLTHRNRASRKPGWRFVAAVEDIDGIHRHRLAREILGVRLLTIHNLHRYMSVMDGMRKAIAAGTFAAFRQAFCEQDKEERE